MQSNSIDQDLTQSVPAGSPQLGIQHGSTGVHRTSGLTHGGAARAPHEVGNGVCGADLTKASSAEDGTLQRIAGASGGANAAHSPAYVSGGAQSRPGTLPFEQHSPMEYPAKHIPQDVEQQPPRTRYPFASRQAQSWARVVTGAQAAGQPAPEQQQAAQFA